MADKIRWGVLGVAKIAVDKVIPAMQRGQFTQVAAIASRSLSKAQDTAAKLGIPRAHGSYEALLADPDVDAVYNPLPNHLHVPWSIRALEAGKHVLCEKPIGLSAAEGQTLVEAGKRFPRLKLMEAFMYRHHPQWQTAKRMVREGRIGELRAIQSFFSYYNVDPANVRNQADIGGGGLLDIGCYNISLSRFLFDREPRRVSGLVEYDPRFGADRLATATLDFGSGVSAFTCSTQLTPYQRVHLFGEAGRIEIEIPFNAPPDRPCKIWFAPSPEASRPAAIETIELPTTDQYTVQGDLFAQAILRDGPVPTPIEDAVLNMRVIEAVVRSGKSGHWETP